MENILTATANRIVIPNKFGNKQKSAELLDNLKSISKEDIQRIGEEMEKARDIRLQRESEERVEKVMGDRDAILKDLKENHVKIETCKMFDYQGKRVCLDLPAVGDFKGFKFDSFVSDNKISKGEFDTEPEFEKKSYSIKEITEFMKALNKYMKMYGVSIDEGRDFDNDFLARKCSYYTSYTGEIFKLITGLYDGCYWMSDKDIIGRENTRGIRSCRYNYCFFNHYDNKVGNASLLLKFPSK